ncbi:ubiquitin carrier protein [Colletotrichum eremochloae]|uniref:Putative ubiquitin carrier protein n=1 Tax=Colletotrichum sublineola TaxID=1173701 RepID=A0A066XGV7_COLSU|nr:ubiquitin carrier protein [Colletotrichum sublineola]KAK2011016.1 ubiquitin carrier protein [Colletotrichum eremochloae]KDN65225.1 putative ubiquitin carrier protein [Colletotrichum sublineola]
MNVKIHHLANAIYRRAVEETPDQPAPPAWSIAVYIANFLVFVPLILWTVYTLHQVYPIFAIVEDENPPAYDPVNLAEDDGIIPSAGPEARADGPVPTNKAITGGRPTTVTSSLRSINRLLKTHGGCRANFRGFSVYLVQAIATSVLFGLFSSFLPGILASLATLLAALSLVQLSTAWVHIVITPRSSQHFWQRLPSFKRTFDATARPVAAYWLSEQVATWVPIAIGWAIGMDLPNMQFGKPSTVSQPQASDAWKSIVVTIISLAFQVTVVIPAHVVLVRVQASLLPEEANTIIPFDRSFGGKVEPRVVGGKGYATMDDAWSGFSRAAWKRLVILYAKIFAVTLAVFVFITAILIPQIILISTLAK